jgi:hypothetical protein
MLFSIVLRFVVSVVPVERLRKLLIGVRLSNRCVAQTDTFELPRYADRVNGSMYCRTKCEGSNSSPSRLLDTRSKVACIAAGVLAKFLKTYVVIGVSWIVLD